MTHTMKAKSWEVRTGRKKILYIGSGGLDNPRCGMDLVSAANLDEICNMPEADVYGLFVSSAKTDVRNSKSTRWSPRIAAFTGDASINRRNISVILKIALYLLSGKFLCFFEFKSNEARRYVRDALKRKPDCIFIDHFFSLANIDMIQIFYYVLFHRARLIYFAHDASPIFIRDMGKLGGIIGRIVYEIQAIQAWIVEVVLFKLAALGLFLSKFDLNWYGRWASSSALVLCPLIRKGETLAWRPQGQLNPQFIFVGAPDFPPNAFAIRWICTALAPALYLKNPSASILLVGKGVETVPWAKGPNIKPLGFVSDSELFRLLNESAAAICPVIHGSGLKVKILEAFAAGCPVFATEESLRGFEFMNVSPAVQIEDPEATAVAMAAFAANDLAQRNLRRELTERWANHVESGRLALAKSVQAVCADVSKIDKI